MAAKTLDELLDDVETNQFYRLNNSTAQARALQTSLMRLLSMPEQGGKGQEQYRFNQAYWMKQAEEVKAWLLSNSEYNPQDSYAATRYIR